MMEQLGSEVRTRMTAPWDEPREQRVLRAVVRGRERRALRRHAIAWGGAAMTVLAGVVFLLSVVRRGELTSVVPAPIAPAEPSTLTLTDGSRVTLPASAHVDIENDQEDLVQLSQTSGQVAYEVTPKPARAFVVRAHGVTVRVVGTRFVVAVKGDRVDVHVDRGRVRVDDGRRVVELGAGEDLGIDSAEPGSGPSIDAGADPDASGELGAAASDGGARPVLAGATAEELVAQADASRSAGQLGAAAAALQELLAKYPRDSRVTSSRFTLGRVERARGNHAAAARSFSAITGGPLVEDATAEAAASWLAAGSKAEARAAAERYLAKFPGGPHVARMRRILE